jgi:hypothetical protein
MMGSECAYVSVAELKDHQIFYEDLLRWQCPSVHLHVLNRILASRSFQNSGAYQTSMHVKLVAVVVLEKSNKNYRNHPCRDCCVYRLTEIVPNLNVTFETYFLPHSVDVFRRTEDYVF